MNASGGNGGVMSSKRTPNPTCPTSGKLRSDFIKSAHKHDETDDIMMEPIFY